LSVVVVLSAFNLYQHSGRIKAWLGLTADGASSLPSTLVNASATEAATPIAHPVFVVIPTPAPIVPAARTPAVKEKKRSGTKVYSTERSAKSPPATGMSEPCRDDVAAVLGLCDRGR